MFRGLKAATETKGAEWPFISTADTTGSHHIPCLLVKPTSWNCRLNPHFSSSPPKFVLPKNESNHSNPICPLKKHTPDQLISPTKEHVSNWPTTTKNVFSTAVFNPKTLPIPQSPNPPTGSHRGGGGADLHRHEEGREGGAVAVRHGIDHTGHLHVVPVDGSLHLHATADPGLLQGRPPQDGKDES